MKILNRYLLREHFGPFVFALAALTGLMVLNQIARQFANLIGKGLPWSVIATVFGLSLPFILAMTIPMAVLVAALSAFSRLGADSEVTAFKANGVSLVRLLRPALLAAVVVSVGEFGFLDQLLPRANHRLKDLLLDIARKRPTFQLREMAVNEVSPGQLFLRAGRIDQADDRMKNVVIYDLSSATHRRTIYADNGYIRLNPSRTDLFLTLFDGYIQDYDRADRASFRRVFFATDLIRVRNVSDTLQRRNEGDIRGDRELTLCEMDSSAGLRRRDVANVTRSRRMALERDALSLVGVEAPVTIEPPLSPAIAAHGSLNAAYCRLLSHLRGALTPDALRADTVRPRRIHLQQPVRVQTPLAPARPAVYADPSGLQLRGQLAVLDSQRRSALQQLASLQVEIHKKYSLAFSCIVFVLVGAPVALRFPRGGMGLVIGASVAIFGLYYIGLIGGESLADLLWISPFWAMWAPNILMGALGIALLARLGRAHASRGGGGRFSRLLPWRRRAARAGRTA